MRAPSAAPRGGTRGYGYIDGGYRPSVQPPVHAREVALAFLRHRLADHGVMVPADADLDTIRHLIAEHTTGLPTPGHSPRTGRRVTYVAALDDPEATS